MSTHVYRILIRYAFIAVFWTVIILALVPFYRVGFVVMQRLGRADICLSEQRYSDAYNEIIGLRVWAGKCPDVFMRMACTEIRCHVGLGRDEEALTCAVRAYEVKRGNPAARLDPIDRIQWLSHSVLSGYVSSTTIGRQMNEWSAFNVLLEEMRRLGRTPAAVNGVMDAIRNIDPANPLLNGIPLVTPQGSGSETAAGPVVEPAPEAPTPLEADNGATDGTKPDGNEARDDDPVSASDARWGVVKTTAAKGYSIKTGKAGARIAMGTLADVTETRRTRSGTLYVCDIAGKTGSVSHVILLEKDLQIYLGSFSNVSTNVQSLTRQVYQLHGQIEKRTLELERQSNPYTATLDKAREANDAFRKQVADLKNKRDRSKGDAHVELSDKLATMRVQANTLENKFSTAEKKYTAWKEANPVDPVRDPKLVQYNSLLEQTERKRENALLEP